MHRATDRFWKCFEKLPESIQDLSNRSFQLLKTNPRHPSLRFKKVGDFWSARIGLDYRALAVEDNQDFIWVWIGTHDEYERMIKEMG
jgi:hypothetical protein